jgi:hypothetical protein
MIYDGNDGITWLNNLTIGEINKKVCFFLSFNHFDKFERKVVKEYRYYTKDTEAIECIDVDRYLSMIMEEFID